MQLNRGLKIFLKINILKPRSLNERTTIRFHKKNNLLLQM